jgi:hypothetical protein
MATPKNIMNKKIESIISVKAVTSAKAGGQASNFLLNKRFTNWIPAFAGMTKKPIPFSGLISAMAVAFLVGTASLLHAGNTEKEFPALELKSLRGEKRDIKTSLPQGRSIVVYILPDSGPSQKLLSILNQENNLPLRNKTVVILGGSSENANKALAANNIKLEKDSYVDEKNLAYTTLGLRGAPTLIGVENGVIRWVLSGLLNDQELLQTVMTSWIPQ